MPLFRILDPIRLAALRRRSASERVEEPDSVPEPPLRSELFSIDQLERHARAIAAQHQLNPRRGPDVMLRRLKDNDRVLVKTYDDVAAAADQNRHIEPAAEWLLDNFYLIEEQIRAIRRLLPPAYSRDLPRLANGPDPGVPRAYAIASELISHVDGRVDGNSLNAFIASYQAVAPLKLGELWALPLMLRLALIENLRRVAIRVAAARRDRDLAEMWAERMIKVVEHTPTDLVIVLADMTRSGAPLSGAFVSELSRHLQGQNPNFAFANNWLEHRLADQGLTSGQLIRAEGQAQAADQVSMGNSISSLRFVSANDWRQFVAEQSVVEQTLVGDPAGVYADMDFATRDRYRHAVEAISRRSHMSEYDVARRAVQLAENQARENSDHRAAHVGYYLIDRGRPVLERLVEMRLTPTVLLEKFRRQLPLAVYLGCAGLIMIVATWWFVQSLQQSGAAAWAIGLLLLPVLFGASQLGIGIVNLLVTRLLTPKPLPRMDYERGIPADQRTLVAVPTMLTSPAGVDHLLEGIELRYLSNRDSNLRFALVTDLTDSDCEVRPEDAELVRLARAGIERLNAQYAGAQGDSFFLFHRARRWNAQEGVWMGYERKRGKLADLNATLRGAAGRFDEVAGDTASLGHVRYVITLDTDTLLPRDAAREMIGTLAHPLNQPVVDTQRNRVVDGYTILQPRVGSSLASSRRTRFVQLSSDDAGLDPYTRVVSDVYQDMFGEGSFIGKGIYDIDSFERYCSDFPENTILSHDLIEGAHGRSGLLSDVTLFEEHPSRYFVDVDRRHRWMRGDWQIAGWLFPRVRGRNGALRRNPLSALSRWKIFDNLRRSLVPIALVCLLVCSWFLSAAAASAALVFVLTVTFLPVLLPVVFALGARPADLPVVLHLQSIGMSLLRPIAKGCLSLAFLPYEACVNADAIVRTLMRMCWTRRRMLEWRTASDAELNTRVDLGAAFQKMIAGPVLGLAATCLLLVIQRQSLPAAAPLIVAWIASPVIAWWLSRPITERPPQLSKAQDLFLRKMSRTTYRYFEEFVTAEQSWLPPDNVQLNPALTVAPRTSPTNIGMALLSDLTACDFGYCPVSRLLLRIRRTLDTMGRMERFHGHLFNWYDTGTLAPLHPRYVSTVDSGNLAASLLVLGRGFDELSAASLLPARAFEGLATNLSILLDAARSTRDPSVGTDVVRRIERELDVLQSPPRGLRAARTLLSRLAAIAGELVALGEDDSEFTWWAHACEQTCSEHLDDLLRLAPWLNLPPPPRGRTEHASAAWESIRRALDELDAAAAVPDVINLPSRLQADIAAAGPTASEEDRSWLEQLQLALDAGAEQARTRQQACLEISARCRAFAEMDFAMLYDRSRELFTIGYNVSDQRLDASFYDLLASEARLASYLAIAQGVVGQQHWFSLGRLLTSANGAPALLSWSGSMFEYLMPLLVMPNYESTLLARTCEAVVQRQINYGRQRNVPWGISESGYNAIDQHRNYQYRAFGVPGLGLKRGLADDLVIAPYATALALMVAPEAACKNLERLMVEGQSGRYGFYEAIDYTPTRLPPGSTQVTVAQFMAHHHGMTLLSVAWLLLDRPMQRRFLADPALKAAELLLQERVPRTSAPVFPHAIETLVARPVSVEQTGSLRAFSDPNRANVEVHLLSNERYQVAISTAGGGYSRWQGLAVTRWREDPTRDSAGSFCYLRDVTTGTVWSNTWQPVVRPADHYEAIFTQARAEFRRLDNQIETYTQISVSPEDDIELRRIVLRNRSESVRTIEVTTYAEVVLAAQAQDEAHPAFSNLFVQTELVRNRQAIFCTRRPRSAEERPPWMLHMLHVRGATAGEASCETDRQRFLGRQRTLAAPAALQQPGPLSNTAGAVLDPIVSIRQAVLIRPGESVQVDVVTGAAESREGVEALAEKYHDASLADRVFDLAWTHGNILLQQLNASEADAQVYARLAGSILYSSASRRAPESLLASNRRGQSGLWGYGISGDLPIVLVRIRDHERIALVRQAVQAHAYWRMKGLAVDLVIWNEDSSVYRQSLQDSITDLVAASPEASLFDRPGGVFIRRGEQMSEEDRVLLQSAARIVLLDDAGTLAEQTDRRARTPVSIPPLRPSQRRAEPPIPATSPHYDLAFFNGCGGFSRDGREYIIRLPPGRTTPAPWSNVIANPQFGTVVTDGGSAYTWAENSHEFRLTPWHNDPVGDLSGEAIYLRDEESGRFWSPSPLPARGVNEYIVRHGFGYTIFDYTEDGITSELSIYVAMDAPVKICKLKITNRSGRTRQLSATAFWELVLGESRSRSLHHVVTSFDPDSGAILAMNPFSLEFGSRCAFFTCSESNPTMTGDRTEFLGRNGLYATPAALRRVRLSGRLGAGFDPCAAFQAPFTLGDGQERIITFVIGAAAREDEARSLAARYRNVETAHRAVEAVWDYWSRTLGAIYLETPDAAVNYLANGWLLYQTLSCRMWARTGLYQSGGAYGFRDQLQDSMALVDAQPALVREHLLRAAARQFREGDVQHWWHPPVGRGVRTHFSDDYLWLPLAICRYVTATGDTGVLDEQIPFLTSRPLRDDEESHYDLPQVSGDIGTLYEHAVRALDRGLRFGVHGLPLMGCGDWNDGMNLVGIQGRGESVWLGFFLFHVLQRFAELAQRRGDSALADRYSVEAGRLRGNIEEHGWDGAWYRRAYFDDGTPLGSSQNEECQIDAISQSWSILSGAGTRERSEQALENVNQRLVRRDARLILLLDPPFDRSALNPGYIKGYVPGVRENGGQYTHSAIWTAMAACAQLDRELAWELMSLINPIRHGATPEDIATYRTEPYVVAADVYGVSPHVGRGGWTWYTGSAGWMYRLYVESLVGLRREANTLRFAPCLPEDWQQFKVHYRFGETFYHIQFVQQGLAPTVLQVTLDGNTLPDASITLVDDRQHHEVEVLIRPLPDRS